MLNPDLVQLPPPFSIPRFPFVQIWHQRFCDDPAHAWLRDQVKQVVAHTVLAD